MPKLNRNGVELYFEVYGQGPVLLLTHGFSATCDMWRGQVETLSRKHTLVIWDMRGHGQSDYPEDPAAYSETLTVADMAALLDQVKAGRAIVGGLSLGGYMSLAFYRAHPERVRALLIIDTGPGFRKDQAREEWNKRAMATAALYEKEGLAALQSASRERSAAKHRSAEGLVRAARGLLTQTGRPGHRFSARDQGPFADHRRRGRQAVLSRHRLYGREDSRGPQSGYPGRRPRRQYRSTGGLHRGRPTFSRRSRSGRRFVGIEGSR